MKTLKVLTFIPILLCTSTVASFGGVKVDTEKPRADVEAIVRKHLAGKHPAYAELRDIQGMKDVDPVEQVRKAAAFHNSSPVFETVHSFPRGPYLTITERTDSIDDGPTLVKLDFHAKDDGTCRIDVTTKKDAKKGEFAFGKGKPLTADAIRELLE